MRILRLSYLARTRPDAPATQELTEAEVQAIVVLRRPSKMQSAAKTEENMRSILDEWEDFKS